MPHKLIAVLLSTVVMIGSLNTASSAPNANPAPSNSVPKTQSPLPPGGAATIKQAQETQTSGPLLGAAVTGGIFLAMLLLVQGEDAGPLTGPVTSQ